MSPRKLSDEDVREILLTDRKVCHEALAEKFGVSHGVIARTRSRSTQHALRVAHKLGLLPAFDISRAWPLAYNRVRAPW